MDAHTGEQQQAKGSTRTARRRRARHKRRRRAPPPIVAAIDLGTNNCRLLIVTPQANGELHVVDSFSRIVRLGEGLGEAGELSPVAIDRTVAALKICGDRIRKSGARHVRAVATHASRSARNSQTLVDRVKEEAGLDLEIVTAEEEARLASIGCAPLMGPRHAGALVFDVGGGSTEAIWIARDGQTIETRHVASLPVGVVNIAERDGIAHQDRAYFEKLTAEMTERFAAVRHAMPGFDVRTHHLLGTSGTVTTLAGIAMGLKRYIRARVDGTWHNTKDIMAVVDHIVALDHAGRVALGCVGEERADLIVPGCAIFAGLYANWPCNQLRVADRGLREGILRELIAKAAR
ncbi:MAG TPA: Ppx/GppA phosphatase family protein [Rhizomicrobium sp.]|nr:Ppx/GppA phosphatase family protein [Rhizomicrobium sp.]